MSIFNAFSWIERTAKSLMNGSSLPTRCGLTGFLMPSRPKAPNGTRTHKNRAANQTDCPDQGADIFDNFKHFTQAYGFNWQLMR
jgi:hypothetical protein